VFINDVRAVAINTVFADVGVHECIVCMKEMTILLTTADTVKGSTNFLMAKMLITVNTIIKFIFWIA